ncbi:MAG: septum site-determining protein MinD [Clostridia bacterium]|nr:septum site-determining protein MinD [Clostridia bacterium]
MVRRIVFTSGKGGVGKTTIVSSLGVVLARKGYKVLLVDMDFGLNNLDVVMGVENKIVYDIIDVIEEKCVAKQALIQDFFENNLFVLPSTRGYCKRKFGSQELIKIISEVEIGFDFVLIDCPAGIDGGFRRAVECAGEHIVVTTPHISAIRDADKIVNCLIGNLGVSPKVVINRIRGDLVVGDRMLGVDDISEFLGGEVIGAVPEDDSVALQLYFGGHIEKCSSVDDSLNMVADNLINGTGKLFDCTKKYKGFVGGIRRKIRGRV